MNKSAVSFELFPPANPAGRPRLMETLAALKETNPAFVSITYGAGGNDRGKSFIAAAMASQALNGTPIAGHLTCAGQSQAETNAAYQHYRELGINRIVALRGDAPGVTGRYHPHENGYANAAALVAGLKRAGAGDISVAAYPECHPESPSLLADLDNLKAKLEAGADRAISQYFFDCDDFLRFRDRAHRHGIHQPLVPGIMLINDFEKIAGFSQKCGTSVPDFVTKQFAGLAPHGHDHIKVATDFASQQIACLQKAGLNQFHIYTMNDSTLLTNFLAHNTVVALTSNIAA